MFRVGHWNCNVSMHEYKIGKISEYVTVRYAMALRHWRRTESLQGIVTASLRSDKNGEKEAVQARIEAVGVLLW